jgi:hypothetical protein
VLPGDPLLGDGIVVRVDGEAELVLGVVVAGEVLQNGESFEDGKAAAVVVDDGGDAAVGVEGRVPRLFLGVFADVDGLDRVLLAVGFLELFEEDGDFPAVGGSCNARVSGRSGRDCRSQMQLTKGQELNARFRDEARRFRHFVWFSLEIGSGGEVSCSENGGWRAKMRCKGFSAISQG